MAEPEDEFFRKAYALETRNSERVSMYARKASLEGREHLARVFRVLTDSRRVHVRRYRMLVRGKVASTLQEMEKAFVEESRQTLDQYQALLEQSRAVAAKIAANTIDQFLCVEEANSSLYEQAARLRESDPPRDYWVCQVCGYVHETEPHDQCPVCGAVPSKFRMVE